MNRAFEIESCFIMQAARKPPLTIDFNDPENMGGKWLKVFSIAREGLRRAAVKAARKAARKAKPKK